MERKFVFESFQEFLDYAGTLNEGVDITGSNELQRYLASAGAPAEVTDAISAVNELCKKTSVDYGGSAGSAYEGVRENGLNSDSISGITTVIDKYTKQRKTKIVSIEVEEKDIDYGNMVAGTVVSKQASKWNNDRYDEDSDRVPLANLLSWVNIANLDKNVSPWLDSEEERFTSPGDYIKGGVMGQMVLEDRAGELTFGKNDFNTNQLFNNWARPIREDFTKVTPSSAPTRKEKEDWAKRAKTNSNTFIVYYPTKIESGKGVTYKSTEIIQYERPVTKDAVTLEPIVIEDDGVLFDQNEWILKPEGKVRINQVLSNITAAKTITVTGGASVEGKREWNEELCQKRAQAVAKYLKEGDFKDADIKVSEKADIQESGSIDKKRRRVTLDITGEQLITSTETGKETVFDAVTAPQNADLVTIKQVAIKITGKWID
jgi:outer membrane protein OmpA-like peptidoglycan-associated protein